MVYQQQAHSQLPSLMSSHAHLIASVELGMQGFVEAIVRNFSDHGVPLDRVVLEPGWQQSQYSWNTAKYPDVPGMIKRIAPTKLILWEHPVLDTSTTFYANLSAHGCIAKAAPNSTATGGMPLSPHGSITMPLAVSFSDLTLARCRQVWCDFQLANAIRSGAVGFKLDEDDVDVNIGFLDSTEFPSGFKGHQVYACACAHSLRLLACVGRVIR